jgi:hypothetical protein
MSRDIKIQIKDNTDPVEALKLLGQWITMNTIEPEKYPITGVMSSMTGLKICRRMYRKTECYIAWQD